MKASRATVYRAIALAASVLFFLAACATAGDAASNTASLPVPASGPEGIWNLVSLRGAPVPADAANPPTLRLSGGTAGGAGGCNSWGASCVLSEPDLIRFSELWSTKMACEDMLLESLYYQTLSEARSWSVSNGMLTLLDGSGTAIALFAQSPDL